MMNIQRLFNKGNFWKIPGSGIILLFLVSFVLGQENPKRAQLMIDHAKWVTVGHTDTVVGAINESIIIKIENEVGFIMRYEYPTYTVYTRIAANCDNGYMNADHGFKYLKASKTLVAYHFPTSGKTVRTKRNSLTEEAIEYVCENEEDNDPDPTYRVRP